MNYRSIALASLFVISATPDQLFAQEMSKDILRGYIVQIFEAQKGKAVCTAEATTLEKVRGSVEEQLSMNGVSANPTPDAIAIAVYTRYPCPFSPFRDQLRAAAAKDVEGVWLFAEEMQRLRYGARSSAWAKQLPLKCEAVAYYPGGELRTAQIAGKSACPFAAAKDMDISRSNPKVSSWAMLKDGRLSVSRTDVDNHVEEWDVFIVKDDFEVQGHRFRQGDLVEYLRREKGNEYNAAMMFRHLRRLP